MQTRYKHKLNMLEPGIKICKIIFILLCTGLLLVWMHIRIAAAVILTAAGILFLVLLILTGIEQHQDHQLYLDAKRNDPDIE